MDFHDVHSFLRADIDINGVPLILVDFHGLAWLADCWALTAGLVGLGE